jgi:hypothetical protein
MIMLQAIACNHGVEPVRNGTALTITKATLRAQVYSAMVRTSFVELKTAAIENPRLITALAAVISAQKRNGMFIQDAYRADAHFGLLLSLALLLQTGPSRQSLHAYFKCCELRFCASPIKLLSG